MTQLARVHNFAVTADGYGSGTGQSLETPFGHVNPAELMAWAFGTASWPGRADGGGSRGLDDLFVREFHRNIGAEIMGRNKFGHQRGPWSDLDWEGWWGEEPPFHTPVFVLTHHPRPSFAKGETTFHFRDASPADVLQEAFAAADGRDVRIGGGVATVLAFVDAGLVDSLHIAVSPIEAGHGERLWESPEDWEDRYEHESVLSPSGVTHHLFWR